MQRLRGPAPKYLGGVGVAYASRKKSIYVANYLLIPLKLADEHSGAY